MTGMVEDFDRRLHHRQPRAWQVDFTREGFVHPDEADEAEEES